MEAHLCHNTFYWQRCRGNPCRLSEWTSYEGQFAKSNKSPGHIHTFGPEILFLSIYPTDRIAHYERHLGEYLSQDFPGGPVVKNPPANAGTQVQSLVWNIPHAAGQLSSCPRAAETLEPTLCNTRSRSEKPSQHNQRRPPNSRKPAQPKQTFFFFFFLNKT